MPAIASPPQLLTAGVIAMELKEPLHRVLRILATRPHIKPKAKAGILRLYDQQAVACVKYELNLIDAKRCRQNEADHHP